MNKTFIIVAFLGFFAGVKSVSSFELLKKEWNAFKLQHNKAYDNATHEMLRLSIFMENKAKIDRHNQEFEKGKVSYELALNEYADLTQEEFISKMTGFNMMDEHEFISANNSIFYVEPPNVEIPNSVDWRASGAVTPIRNQGTCGSCWAFSAAGALEGQHFLKTKQLVPLSEQNLIDCSKKQNNHGCKGGLMSNAFQYVKENGGIDTERSYPYKGTNNNACMYDAKNSGATDRGFVIIPPGDEVKLQSAIATIGPIAIALDVSHNSFYLYKTGVYYEPNCSSTNLQHAVLVVGYGTDKTGADYYIIKNSWGTRWGYNGYMKIARNRNNHCGVASMAVYPLV